MRTITLFTLIALVTLLLSPVSASRPGIDKPLSNPPLRLHRGTFDARTATRLAPTAALAAPAPGPYAIIQLHGPVTLADRQALQQTGVKLLEYLPDYAYLVRGTPAQLDAAASLPQTYARTPFTLADKLAPSLLRAVTRGDSKMGQVRILGWPGDKGALARDLEAIGLKRQAEADAALVLKFANLESVRWIEPAGRPRILNDYAREIMNVEPAWQDHQLFGAGQVLAIADSGLDTGDAGTLSPDFAGRIVATHVLSPGGHWDDNNGHGTHVAGSAAGAGVQSGADVAQRDYAGSFAGVAPEAGLVIQAFEALTDGTVIGLDPDYYQLFDQAYADGARLHSDSWGDYTGPVTDTEAAFGGYPYGSQRTDRFMWDHPDMALFVAAGNAGVDGTPTPPFGFCPDGDGVVDLDSLLAPGTAKNVISVGASESNRNSGGVSSIPWLLLNFCFSTEPIATDLPANNSDGMAAFSSRGPADDGRAKPDLVAPGTNIVSNRSHHPDAGVLWGAHETNPDYVYSGGTSMATPLAAGSGVLVRQWLSDVHGQTNPSAAAIKAVLLNTTHDMAPGQYGTGDTQEIPYARPNDVTGWGRLDLGFISAPAPYALWLDDHASGLSTGQTVSYTHAITRPLEVLDSAQPLRVMLAWTDYPASLSASAQLVNDLDLVITGPGGTTYYGNDVAAGDRVNNVEGVIVDSPPLGRYEIQVSGFNVPTATQPYALVVAGPLAHQATLAVAKWPDTGAAELGQTVTYTYRVTNTGTLSLTGIAGNDDKLGTVTFNLGTLEPNQSASGTLTHTVQPGDLPGPLVNTVWVSGTTVATPITTATATITATVNLTSPADMTVVKLPDVDVADVGQTVTYTYRVTNTGTLSLTGITGDDDKLGPVTFSPDSLEPDQSASGTLTYTVQADDLPGPLVNTVRVSGTTSVGPPILETASAGASVDLNNPAKLAATKMPAVELAEVGQVVTYTYRVTNTGTLSLTGIAGTDDRLGAVTFSPGTLEPNQSASGTLTYTVQADDLPGPLVNTVQVSGTTFSGPPITAWTIATATVDLAGLPALTVAKSPNADVAQVGQTVIYVYQVTNSGTTTLTDVAGSDDQLGPVTLSPTTLAPGQNALGILTHTVQVDNLPGPLVNTVRVSGTTVADPIVTVTATRAATVSLVNPAALTVVKTPSPDTAEVGQNVAYIYQATNSGTVTLTNVTGHDDRLGPVTLSPATLPPGQTATGALFYTVQRGDLPGPLTNTVRVSGTTFSGPLITATATATATVNLTGIASIALTKTPNVSAAQVGQRITYTYRVTNDGAFDLIDVAGDDDRLGPLPFSTRALSPNQSATATLTYTVQTGDLPGPLVNTAGVHGMTAQGSAVMVTATATATINLSGPAALTVSKTANVAIAETGQTLTYTYRVTNSGTVSLTTIVGHDDRLGAVPFSPTTLAPDQSAAGLLTYTVRPGDLPGPLTNTVRVSGTTLASPARTATAQDTATVTLKTAGLIYLPIIFKHQPIR